MAVEIGKATEKQMKYLAWLSKQGKEVYGEKFSVRNLASQLGYTWPPTRKEASDLIDKIKHFIDKGLKSQEFSVSTLEKEQSKAPASPSSQVYMIQIFVDESNLTEVESFLNSVQVGYIVYEES